MYCSEMYIKFLIVPILFVFGQESDCGSKTTCSKCIQQSNCVWCISPVSNHGFSKAPVHCLPKDYKEKNLFCNNAVILESKQSISKNDDFSDGANSIQIKPQRINLSLRKGEPMNINFQYKQASNYPVDLYYLMDLSNSMLEHKHKLAKLGIKLAMKLKEITNDVRLGFGSFIDKVELPFTSTAPDKLISPCKGCDAPYSFKNHLALTQNYSEFQTKVKTAKVSGNLDSPEGGLDAIMQAIVCKKEIGWRSQARHLLVFSTDAEFHIAGDGKLAGVIEPNDAKCHLAGNTYKDFLKYDYPSVSQINYIAKENNINIIFAIVNKTGLNTFYEELSKNVENSKQGVLIDIDDNNIIDLVVDNYNKIVQSVTLSHNASNDIDIKISATCEHPIENGCSDVHEGILSFNATIELRKCPASESEKQIISIKPNALDEALTIDLEVICDCPCSLKDDPTYEAHSSKCNKTGDLVCGVCKCYDGRTGRNCECSKSNGWSNDTTNCIREGQTEFCSGLGECKCGVCECNKRDNKKEEIYGNFCECDNYSCMKGEGNLLCSGKGTCDCGNCSCHAGYTGEACECVESNSGCIAPGTDIICSGHGWCNCGSCQCNDTDQYTGKYCQECKTCPAQRCDEIRHCVECQAYQTGIYDNNDCESNCTEFTTEVVIKLSEDNIGDVKKCRVPDKLGCIIIFEYIDKDKKLTVRAQKEKLCPGPPNILAWILGVIGTILLAGLIMLIVWKVCTSIHDRREYAKFENERKGMKWHRNDNPLYKGATSTFANPVYNRSNRLSTK